MKKLPVWRTSPSLISLMRCEARALAQYLEGYKEDFDQEKAAEGKRLHKVIQDYLVLGTQPDVDDLAALSMLKCLPFGAGSVLLEDVERKVQLKYHSGYVDARKPGHVLDLKWTSALKYQTEVDPEKDPARIIYAANEYKLTKLPEIKLSWCVAEFKGTRRTRLDLVWSAKHIQELLGDVVEPVRKKFLQHRMQNTPWQTAAKNARCCNLYPPGGCIMHGVGCKRTIEQLIEAILP